MGYGITYQDATGAHGSMAFTYATLGEAEEVAADLVVRLKALAQTEGGTAAALAVDIHDEAGNTVTFNWKTDISEPLNRFMAKEAGLEIVDQPPMTVDLTPTWSGILPALLMVLESGTAEGRKMAREELRRMAQAADQANAK